MKSVAELQQMRAQILAEAEEILDNADANDRQVSEDEDQRVQACMAKVDELDADIKRYQALEKRQAVSFETPKTPQSRVVGASPMDKPDPAPVMIPRVSWHLPTC